VERQSPELPQLMEGLRGKRSKCPLLCGLLCGLWGARYCSFSTGVSEVEVDLLTGEPRSHRQEPPGPWKPEPPLCPLTELRSETAALGRVAAQRRLEPNESPPTS